MLFIKPLPLVGALSAILAIFATMPVKAATVTGSVTGTWDSSSIVGINPNDSFTATYAYDTSNLLPYDNSAPDLKDVGYLISSLSSLQIKSDTINYIIDLASGGGYVLFEDYAATSPSYSPASFKAFTLFGSDPSYSFSAYHQVGLDNGIPFNLKQVELDTLMGSVVAQSNATFTTNSATAVPTPALLPGLIGLGVGMLHKRRKVTAKV